MVKVIHKGDDTICSPDLAFKCLSVYILLKAVIDNCFKTFVDMLFIKCPPLAKVKKKLWFCHHHTLQSRTKLKKSLKGLLSYCKHQIVFKRQEKLSKVLCFKDHFLFDLLSGAVYKYAYGRCHSSYYGEKDRHLKVRSGEHIGVSLLTFKKTKPSKDSVVNDHLLNFSNISSFVEFTILGNGNNKFILDIKENLLMKRDKPILNKNISFAKLFLFGNS